MPAARCQSDDAQGSALERMFDTLWAQLGGPALTAEYMFAPPRRWRFDRAHVAMRVAIELDGGVWTGGRHVRGGGFARDCEKLNAAAARGWLVFRLTTSMLADRPAEHLLPIMTTIAGRTTPCT